MNSSSLPRPPLFPQHNRCRSARTLDGVWEMARESPENDYRAGFVPEKRVAVPASLNDLFTEAEFRDHPGGVWLQRRFFVDADPGRRWTLHFGSAAYRAEVYVNGSLAGGHEGWAVPFGVEIGACLRAGEENLLCVRLDGILSAKTVPQGNMTGQPGEPGQISHQFPDVPFDFYPFVGLHRSVTLCSTGEEAWLEAIALESQGDLETGKARLKIRAEGGGGAHALTVRVPELGVEGRVAGERDWAIDLDLGEVEWWSPRSPRLHRCECSLADESGRTLDAYTLRFGVRTVTIEADGLHLNGERIELRGFGMHEDFPVIGKGHNDAVMIRNFELLRWMGANSFRTTHYPYAEEVLDLADETGVLVIGECAFVSPNFDQATEATLVAHRNALLELIARDRHHPCVIAWSMGNEGASDHPRADAHFASLATMARKADSSRLLTYVTHCPKTDRALPYCDFVGINVYPGWYHLAGRIEAAVCDLEQTLTALHQRLGKPILVTEFGADAIAGFHALPAVQWSEDYQAELIVALSRKLCGLPFVFGQHVWNLFDFRTAQHHFRANGNHKGVFTRERQPKLAARLLREEWARQRSIAPSLNDNTPTNPR